jgi:hypothetical protein
MFKSVKDLNVKIRIYIERWNQRAHPFTWTRTAEEILAHAKRNEIQNADH